MGLPGSVFLASAAAAGLPVVTEAFADRAYTADGTLVPRTVSGAVIEGAEQVAARAVGFAVEQAVIAVTGERVSVSARSLCVHGDSPGAVAAATAVRSALAAAGVEVGAFA